MASLIFPSPANGAHSQPSTEELLGALRSFLYKLHTDHQSNVEGDHSLRLLLSRLGDRLHIRVRLAVGDDWPDQLPAALAANLYRLLEEVVTTAHTQGGADDVSIRLRRSRAGGPELLVTSNGSRQSESGEGTLRGTGSLWLRDRISALGGDLQAGQGRQARQQIRITFPPPLT